MNPSLLPPCNTESGPPGGARLTQARPARSRRVENDRERIKLRILIPLLGGVGILLAAFILTFHWEQARKSARAGGRTSAQVQSLLQGEVDEYSAFMRTTMQTITKDEKLAEAFRAADRAALLEQSKPILDTLSQNHHINRLSFHTPDRTNLLRVHSPARSGGKVDRYTLATAAQTGQVTSGVECDSNGTFVLRVVSPWYQGDTLLGYIDLGMEFEEVAKGLQELLGVDFLVAVDKQFIDREQWQQTAANPAAAASWDQFPRQIVMNKTVGTIPLPIAQYLSKAPEEQKDFGYEPIHWDGRYLQVLVLPMKDAAGRTLGKLFVLRDVTDSINGEHRSVLTVSIICAIVSALLVLCFSLFLGRIENGLAALIADLKGEVALRQEAEASLLQAHEGLEERVRARTVELQLAHGRLERIVTNTPGMVFQFVRRADGSPSFPFVSAGSKAIFNLDRADIQGHPTWLEEIIHPEDRAAFQASLAATPFWSWEGRVVLHDGSIRWVQCVAQMDHEEDNGDVLWDGLIVDVTERKQAAEAQLARDQANGRMRPRASSFPA